jgi:hypothetical protein
MNCMGIPSPHTPLTDTHSGARHLNLQCTHDHLPLPLPPHHLPTSQSGTPTDIIKRPATPFVMNCMGIPPLQYTHDHLPLLLPPHHLPPLQSGTPTDIISAPPRRL